MTPHYPHEDVHGWCREAVLGNAQSILHDRIGNHDVEAAIIGCAACTTAIRAWRAGRWGEVAADLHGEFDPGA